MGGEYFLIENYNAIKFYSNRDLSIGYYLELSEPVIKSFDSSEICSDVNRAIELYNIQQLMESGCSLPLWDSEKVTLYKSKCRSMNPTIGKFFAGVSSSNVIQLYQSLNVIYTADYWTLISKYKVYKRIDGATFKELLLNGANIWEILEHKDLVASYDEIIADYLRSSKSSAELLLNQLLSNQTTPYFLPMSLQPSEYESIFERYIDDEDANPNYVKLIITSRSSKECPISPKLRQKAKRRYMADIQKRFSEQTSFEYGVEVAFLDTEEPLLATGTNPLIPRFEYSKKWILENLDYPTLLNNFRYLFEYTDACWRSTLVANTSSISALERAFGIKGKTEYVIGALYRFHDVLSLVQMRGYRSLLSENGVDIEDLFTWFFQDYLESEFQIDGFIFRKSSNGTSIVEKCRNLAAEMDGIFKQYRAIIQDGYIDRELFELTSEHIVFSELGSFQRDKYAYAKSKEIQAEMACLFSDQSMLGYTELTKAKYSTLYDLLSAETVRMEDFQPYQIPKITWLINRGVISESEEKYLRLNEHRVFILKDMFDHDVICPHYYSICRPIIDELVSCGDFRYGSTLFSEPEQAYLNYHLNQAEFSNGLDLRNRYIHSTYSQDKQIQEHDYDCLLRIMVLVIMKINEEFCLKYPLV